MTLVNDTHTPTGEKLAQGKLTLRRLFDILYQCPLCGQQHNAETYVAHTTVILDDLHAHAQKILRHPSVALPLLGDHISFVHIDQGDYRRLRQEAEAGNPKGNLRIISVTMTAESELSCTECAARFPTIPDLWSHMGIAPATASRVRDAECFAYSG